VSYQRSGLAVVIIQNQPQRLAPACAVAIGLNDESVLGVEARGQATDEGRIEHTTTHNWGLALSLVCEMRERDGYVGIWSTSAECWVRWCQNARRFSRIFGRPCVHADVLL